MGQFLRRFRLPILSGLLIGTSYIPFYPWALFFGLIPLWLHCLQTENPRQVFWAGWITQFILTLIGFHWVAYTAHEFGHLPWVVSVPVLFAFCAFANLHIPLAVWLWAWLRKRFSLSLAQSITLLTLFTATTENLMPMIFPWHHGYPWLWAGWQGFQFADVIGFVGLSVLSISLNGWILWLWLQRGRRRFALSGLIATALFLVVFQILGALYGKKYQDTDASFRILQVQANIGNILKYYAQEGSRKAGQNITRLYYDLTTRGLNESTDVDFIIWPETAFPVYLNPPYQRRALPRRLKEYVEEKEIPLITGAYSRDPKLRKTYNSLFFLNREGEILDPAYRKTILLAFGEYFPGSQYFPFLKDIVPTISDFGRGSGPTAVPFEGVLFGPQICYEGLYPDFSQGLVEQGAQVFVNVTNDSWFGKYFEPYQHLYMTLARAVEFRRPLVRNTNTGYSATILADGSISELSPIMEKWAGVHEVKYLKSPPTTFYSRYQQYFSPLLALICVLCTLGFILRARKQGNL